MYLLLLGYLVILQIILTFVHLVVCVLFTFLYMNAQNSRISQSNECYFLENQNFFTTHIDSPFPSPSFSALPLFTNSSTNSKTSKLLIVYQRCLHTTSNQVPAASVPSPTLSSIVDLVPALPSAPLRHSTRVCRPPDRFGFTSPLLLTATLSSISIPICYKQAVKYECWQKAIEIELLALEENQP
ncbi:hypothetical protein ACOSQ3_023430 [Xanthoceras sorbifolium]